MSGVLQSWRKSSRPTSSGCSSSGRSWTSCTRTPRRCTTRSGTRWRLTVAVSRRAEPRARANVASWRFAAAARSWMWLTLRVQRRGAGGKCLTTPRIFKRCFVLFSFLFFWSLFHWFTSTYCTTATGRYQHCHCDESLSWKRCTYFLVKGNCETPEW